MSEDSPQFFTLVDGRKLCYQEYGDPRGHPVVYAHGAPSSRLEGKIFDKAAKDQGFRFISTDRPGFGQSDYLPNRQWADYVKDIEQLTAHLDIGRFGHIGWSGGGPPTLAVARHIPQRLDFAISLAGQPGMEDPDDKKLLSTADRIAVSLLHTSPMFFRSFFGLMAAMEKLSPEAFYKSFIKASSPDDARILSIPENKEFFNRIQAEAFRQGGKGVAWDAEIDYQDFGFRAVDIDYPVHVFQGDEDNFVSHDLQKKYIKLIPGAVLHELPGRGHFFPLEMQRDVLHLARQLLAQQN